MKSRVVVTGVGVVTGAVAGGRDAVTACFQASGAPASRGRVADVALEGLIHGDTRRLSRVCRLAVAATHLALADSGLDAAGGLGLVVGSEFGDLRSTLEFVDGYLDRGPQGLSALLFPNTVMNTMAATAAIAVRARELSLTLNAPTVAGELALARAARAIAAGRAEAVLAGGVDELDPLLATVLDEIGAADEVRGEGAGFVVLESLDAAFRRGARVLGEIGGVAWRALAARPYGVGRGCRARAVAEALGEAGAGPADIDRVYTSASGDLRRDRWESAVLDAALGPHRPERVSPAWRVGRHSGTAALAVAAAVGAPRGTMALVHGLARGGTHVALVVRAGPP